MFKSRHAAKPARVDEVAGQRAHRPDYQLVLYMGLLMLIGLVIIYAIGPQRANVLNQVNGTTAYTDTYFVLKQLVSLGLAVVAFFITSKLLPFSLLKKHAQSILLVGLGLCALLVVTGNILHLSIALDTGGAYRWFSLGPLGSLQPAEFLKFGVLLYLAVFLAARAKQGLLNNVEKTVIPAIAVALTSLFFVVVVQKDMGTGIALGSIIAAVLMVSGMSRKIGAKLIIGTVILGVIAVVAFPHRMERVTTFLQGDNQSSAQADDNSYHIRNAMIALGTGNMFGRGIGNSIQATGYLPEAINDSVFAIMGETFGFVGVCIILALFTMLLMRLLKIADHLPDMAMRLTVAGVFGWLVAHIVLNVASMIGVFPLTGITLPLVSFGGTSMIFITAALGLAFQLSKYTVHTVLTEEAAHESTSGRRGIRGTRLSGRRRI